MRCVCLFVCVCVCVYVCTWAYVCSRLCVCVCADGLVSLLLFTPVRSMQLISAVHTHVRMHTRTRAYTIKFTHILLPPGWDIVYRNRSYALSVGGVCLQANLLHSLRRQTAQMSSKPLPPPPKNLLFMRCRWRVPASQLPTD